MCHVARSLNLWNGYLRATWNTLLCGQVNIGSRRCSSASGYDVSCIWNCGGWSGYFAVAPSLCPHQVPYVDTYLLRHRARLNWGKSLGNTHVALLVCSSIPPLKNQTSLEFLVNWFTPHYHSQRQKLAAQSHTPTLLHINRRD